MELLLFLIIILAASFLQTSTGFGFSILATPFLLLLFEPVEAIQINLILSLFISAALIWNIRKDVELAILKRLIAGSIVGLPLGILAFMLLNVEKLKVGISLIIFVLTVLLIFKVRVKPNKKRDGVVGGLSGLLTTGIGMPGPPLLLYFAGTNTSKEILRGTTLAFYLFIYSTSLIIQVGVAGTNRTIWISSGWALPLVCVGLYLGQKLFHWMNPAVFRIIIYTILLFTAIYLFIETQV